MRTLIRTRGLSDERSAAALRLENAFAFQIRIRAIHGIRVDGERDGDFANRWKLIAVPQRTPRDCMEHLIAHLEVERNARAFVDSKVRCSHHYIVLVH